jgi:hypothetical protein
MDFQVAKAKGALRCAGSWRDDPREGFRRNGETVVQSTISDLGKYGMSHQRRRLSEP